MVGTKASPAYMLGGASYGSSTPPTGVRFAKHIDIAQEWIAEIDAVLPSAVAALWPPETIH